MLFQATDGGGCLNEALNWSVKGLGGLTFCAAYSPNLLLIVSHKSQLRLLLIIINPHLFFIFYFDCAISQDSDHT